MSGFADVSGKRYVCFVNRSTAIVGGLLDLQGLLASGETRSEALVYRVLNLQPIGDSRNHLSDL